MNAKVIVGIALLGLSVVTIVTEGSRYLERLRNAEASPTLREAAPTQEASFPPILGAIALVGGVAFLLDNKQKSDDSLTSRLRRRELAFSSKERP
jgi:hypothetical protein